MYKKIFMMISCSFSMMTLMASENAQQNVQPLSSCEQITACCIFAACYGCDYRFGGVGLDMAIEDAKHCLSCPGSCVRNVQSGLSSISDMMIAARSMRMEREN